MCSGFSGPVKTLKTLEKHFPKDEVARKLFNKKYAYMGGCSLLIMKSLLLSDPGIQKLSREDRISVTGGSKVT